MINFGHKGEKTSTIGYCIENFPKDNGVGRLKMCNPGPKWGSIRTGDPFMLHKGSGHLDFWTHGVQRALNHWIFFMLIFPSIFMEKEVREEGQIRGKRDMSDDTVDQLWKEREKGNRKKEVKIRGRTFTMQIELWDLFSCMDHLTSLSYKILYIYIFIIQIILPISKKTFIQKSLMSLKTIEARPTRISTTRSEC